MPRSVHIQEFGKAGPLAATRPLFTPYRMGDLDRSNRIVMAPLIRTRAGSDDHVPSAEQAEYYAQRATAGLIVTEGVAISPEGFGWADTPGPWTEEQVRGWRRVTDAVQAVGGRIVAQLWHTGAMPHPDLRGGALPVSASDVDPEQRSVTAAGRVPTVPLRPITRDEIRQTVADYARAARNAMRAGFDGVQIQANYLYLRAQFLSKATNRRTDKYGGEIEGRARFLFEVVEAILGDVEPAKVGVKIGPMHKTGPFAANDETLPMAEYAIRELSGYGLSHLLIMGNTTGFTGTPLEPLMGDGMFRHFRPMFRGTLIANTEHDCGARQPPDRREPCRPRRLWPALHRQSGPRRAPEDRRPTRRDRQDDSLCLRARGLFRLPGAAAG